MNVETKYSTVGNHTSEVEVLNISRFGFWLGVLEHEYFLPFERFPWFQKASIEEILKVEMPHPSHLYWPNLDVDLDLDSIRSPEKYPLMFQRSSERTSEKER